MLGTAARRWGKVREVSRLRSIFCHSDASGVFPNRCREGKALACMFIRRTRETAAEAIEHFLRPIRNESPAPLFRFL